MPRRANDPDLLRAQARGGRDGERIYTETRQQLEQQRRAAVSQAMQEAAIRGAPQGALAQLRGQVSAPYNSAIRDVTLTGASYGRELADRRVRMADYAETVAAARELIPTQVQSALAPIRAENRFRLESISREGANRVSEIEAQGELQRLQMQLANQAQRLRDRRAAAAPPTLNQSELGTTLESSAYDILSQLQTQAQQLVERNQTAIREDPDVVKAQGMATGASLATMYGAGVYTPSQQVSSPASGLATMYGANAPAPQQQPNVDMAGLARMYGAPPPAAPLDLPGPQPYTPTTEQARLLAGIGDLPEYSGNQPAIASQLPSPAGGLATMFGAGAPTPPAPTAPPQAAGPRYGQSLEDVLQGLVGGVTRAQGNLAGETAPFYDPTTGYLPIRQLGRLTRRYGDVAAPLLGYAQNEPITDPREVAEVVGGQPTESPYGQEGEILPSATQSWQQAMGLAAQRLSKQGYNITGPEVQVALGANRGRTLLDMQNELRGLPPVREQMATQAQTERDAAEQAQQDYEDMVKEQQQADEDAQTEAEQAADDTAAAQRQADADARRDAADRRARRGRAAARQETAAKQRIYDLTRLAGSGLEYTDSLGPLGTVLDIVSTPEFSDPQTGALHRVLLWLQNNADNSRDPLDIEDALNEEFIADNTTRNLIKAAIG